ncbi:hypothetical protein ANACOL_04334 [Anaerotruncus colihominis DSM 17241]|uniref:Uncharacterized protein n=1 Tax=Anaerotruncus colihominis DSM 17241 TaxID=445972 RepID=B0PHP1_9FIRM|nr:hypothetical protein ANACOL_04334 [Anaerotruncus colihominis DSM 17241]
MIPRRFADMVSYTAGSTGAKAPVFCVKFIDVQAPVRGGAPVKFWRNRIVGLQKRN